MATNWEKITKMAHVDKNAKNITVFDLYVKFWPKLKCKE